MKHARLVIADAHENMREAVQTLLRDRFEAVVMVADGDSLLQVSNCLTPDLIIVDLSLPVSGTGNILCSLRLQTLLPSAKVIVLSVHDEVEAVHEAFAAGAMGFVLKGAAATDLVPAVGEVLRGRMYLSPGAQPENRPSA